MDGGIRGSARAIAHVLRSAFGTSALARLQLGFAAVSLAHWASMIALAVYAYDRGGAAAVGLVSLARLLPVALITPLTSLVADRFSRRDVLAASSALRAFFGLVTAAAALAGLPLWAVVGGAIAQGICGTPYRPAQAALMPQLARTPQQMAASNVVWNGLESVGFLIGALAGGILMEHLDPGAAFALLALPFAVSALLVAGIPRDAVAPHREALEGARIREEALAGYRTALHEPSLRTLLIVLTGGKLVEGAIDTLIVLVALDELRLAESGVGYLNAAWAVGGIGGMVLALGLLHRGTLAVGLTLGAHLIGVALLVLAASGTLAVALAALLVVGVGYALVESAGETLMQRLSSDAVLARVFGALEGSYLAATGIGAALAAPLASLLGIGGALAVVGAALPLVALARWRALARLEAGAEIPERPFELLRGVPLFAPLPVASVENLTLRLDAVEVGAGEEVIVQGEPGERFFVIDSGRVDVLVDGCKVRDEGPGEFFGEIALLRSVPRTATVRASEATTLLALDSGEFLAGVTGDPRALRAADAVVDGRLGTAAAAP